MSPLLWGAFWAVSRGARPLTRCRAPAAPSIVPAVRAAAPDRHRGRGPRREERGVLRAGVYATEITPPVGVTLPVLFARAGGGMRLEGVHDPLWAKALVLDDGATEVAVVATDLLGLDRRAVAAIRARVQEECGLPAD